MMEGCVCVGGGGDSLFCSSRSQGVAVGLLLQGVKLALTCFLKAGTRPSACL